MTDVPCWHGGRRCDLDFVESKPRDLGSDRGYRVVAVMWAMLSLNPHPFKTERVRHPNTDSWAVSELFHTKSQGDFEVRLSVE
jgi:hypothetical protein